jgi:predicted amino acid dehydrogenase
MVDPSLRSLSPAARRALADRMIAMMQLRPTVTSARNLFGGRVWFAVLLLPADVGLLETLHRMDYRYLETERLQEAVDLGASLGCSCVALGGYTSILARDGTAVLPPPGVCVTSGNTFTAVVGARRLLEACRHAEIDPAGARLGVVGGTGNIGSSLVRRLRSEFGHTLLVGRDPRRLAGLRSDLDGPGRDVEATTDLGDLRRCNVIAIATNTNEPLVYPEHVPSEGAVVIADVSVPGAVSQRVRALEHVRVIPLAGTVAVPGAPDLVLSSHTAPGTAFCCAAEAMLIGLEPEATSGLRLTGAVDPRAMEVLDRLAERHGFFEALGEGGFRP